MRSSSRRTRSRSICDRRLRRYYLLTAEVDPGERVRAHGARNVSLHLLLEAESRLRMGIGNGREELHDQDVGLLVKGDPLVQVRLGGCPCEDVEDLRVVETELGMEDLEERPQEVVRVTEVTRPTDQVDVAGRPVVDVLDVVRTPRRAVWGDLEPRPLEARREGLEVQSRARHIRPRDVRRVPEVNRDRKAQARGFQ